MKFNVSPLTCSRCVLTITEALLAVDPDARVLVNLAAGTVDTDGALDEAAVAKALAPHGYTAVAVQDAGPRGPEPSGGCCGTCHA